MTISRLGSSKAPLERLGRYFLKARRRLCRSRREDSLDIRVLEDFSQNAAIAAANDEDGLRILVSKKGNVGHHFVVDRLVGLRLFG